MIRSRGKRLFLSLFSNFEWARRGCGGACLSEAPPVNTGKSSGPRFW